MLCQKQPCAAKVPREGVLHSGGQGASCLPVCLSVSFHSSLTDKLLRMFSLYLHPAPAEICLLQPCPSRTGLPGTDRHLLRELLLSLCLGAVHLEKVELLGLLLAAMPCSNCSSNCTTGKVKKGNNCSSDACSSLLVTQHCYLRLHL